MEKTLGLWKVNNGSDWFAPDWACLALADIVNRDSMERCLPPVVPTFGAPPSHPIEVRGEMAYLGFDPREYAYRLTASDDGARTRVTVRIAFDGLSAVSTGPWRDLQGKLDRAAQLWTTYAPRQAFEFRFVAEIGAAAEHPHFRVSLVAGQPRTPFDVTWGSAWPWHLMAHEVGHMMGLDDEYRQLDKTLGHMMGKEADWRRDRSMRLRIFECHDRSLMCDSKGEDAVPLAYHYYALARRRFCRPTPRTFEGL